MTLQEETGTWGDITFPQGTPRAVMAHLSDEIQELAAEVELFMASPAPTNGAALAEEAADCLLLLYHLAHKCGFDLEAEARRKLEKNRQRTWGEPDARGVVRHVE